MSTVGNTLPLSDYFTQTWNTHDGLPHNGINAISQSRDGYLWTPDGDKFEPEFISKIRIMQRSAGYQQSQIMQQQGKLKNLAHVEKMKSEIARLASEIQNITTHTESELHAFELTLLDPQSPPSLKVV